MGCFSGKRYFMHDVLVGKKGQIVIPKDVRALFDINSGDQMIMVIDSVDGIGLVKPEKFKEFADFVLKDSRQEKNKKVKKK